MTRGIASSGGCGGVADDDDSNNFNFARANDVRKYMYLRSKDAQCKLMASNATPP